MTSQALNKSHPLAFFVLVFALSVPVWIIGVGSVTSYLPDNIPVTDIGATLSPLIAACLLVYMEIGTAGLKRFLARTLDYKRIRNIGQHPIVTTGPPYTAGWLKRHAAAERRF